VLLVIAVVIAAATSGIGHANVPSGDVAKVDRDDITVTAGPTTLIDNGAISQEAFDASLKQAALRQGVKTVPQPGDPQYDQLRDQALGDLLDIAWITGEAKDQGVEVSDREVQQAFQQTKQQNFKTEAEYQKFLKTSGFTQDDVNLRVKLQKLSEKIQTKLSSGASDVSDSEVQDFYDQNKEQFQQPESRDIRLILNKDQAKVEEAKKALDADNSDANWQKVAAQDSTDPSSKDKGGVRQGVTKGTLEGDLDAQVFGAPTGQVVGPVQTPLGFYVFQVDKVTPATTQPLSAVEAQLKQQLAAQKQQTAFSSFIDDYRAKWTNLTQCADGFVIDRCDNFSATAVQACDPAQAKQTGCPPPVTSRSPVAPGTAGASGLGGASGGSPQRPHPAGEGAPAPTGSQSIPISPGGAAPQGAPPGAAPPG